MATAPNESPEPSWGRLALGFLMEGVAVSAYIAQGGWLQWLAAVTGQAGSPLVQTVLWWSSVFGAVGCVLLGAYGLFLMAGEIETGVVRHLRRRR